MIIGIPKEIKDNEYRVGMVPGGVQILSERGHRVLVERSAGEGSGFDDRQYQAAGAELIAGSAELFERAEMVVKVKEPLEPEYALLRPAQILFTYLHLAPLPGLTQALIERKVIAIAYETIRTSDGSLPLLTPMSEVAGRMSVQIGAYYLERSNGGAGILLGGVPGVAPAEVVIIGGGVVGINAAKMAVGLGARVTLLEKDAEKMRYIEDIFGGRVTTLMSNPVTINEALQRADLLIGAVLLPGASAPKLVKRAQIGLMKKGAVIVDVAVDQGGCIETTRPTTHSKPTFEVDGVVHYCVANMPGAVPRTSTLALTNVTFPYALRIAERGLKAALAEDPALREGVNVYHGKVTCEPVARSQGLEFVALDKLL